VLWQIVSCHKDGEAATVVKLQEQMKTILKLWVVGTFLCSIPLQGETGTSDWENAPLKAWVRLTDRNVGWLLYRKSVQGFQIVALSVDTGSARPDADLRLYLIGPKGIFCVARFSDVHREFRVSEVDGNLLIFLFTGHVFPKETQFASINLKELVDAYSDREANEWQN
jgi:hypothetical protein